MYDANEIENKLILKTVRCNLILEIMLYVCTLI